MTWGEAIIAAKLAAKRGVGIPENAIDSGFGEEEG